MAPSAGPQQPPGISLAPPGSFSGPFGCLVAAALFHFASLYYLLPTLPLYVRDLGGSTSEVGLVIGVLALASLLTRPFLGLWLDRTNGRAFLVGGAALYVLAALGYWTISSVPALLVWRVFHGIGLATFSTAASSMAADFSSPGRRGVTMGAFGLAQAAALAVGPGMGQSILSAFGYPALFLASAGTAGVALVFATMLPGSPRMRHPESTDDRETGLAHWRASVAPAVLQFAASVAYGTLISFIAIVAQDRKLGPVGPFFALLALSSLGVRLVAGKAYDTWGAGRVLVPLFLAVAAGMALLSIAAHPALLLLAAVLAGVGVGGAHTTLLTTVVDRASIRRRASSAAIFAACWELGVGGGTILMGRLADIAGFGAMYLVVAALSLVGLTGLGWLGRAGRSSPQPPK